MEHNGEFARLAKDFGGHDNAAERTREQDPEGKEATEAVEVAPDAAPAKTLDVAHVKDKSEKKEDHQQNKLEGRLMVAETRVTGSVSWKGEHLSGRLDKGRRTDFGLCDAVYGEYSKAGKGWIMIPVILVLCVLMVSSTSISLYYATC